MKCIPNLLIFAIRRQNVYDHALDLKLKYKYVFTDRKYICILILN